MFKFTLGCDPELFLQDAQSNLVSAIGKIGGTKSNPRPISSLGDGFAVQEDNVALEYNIPPAATEEQFTTSIKQAVHELSQEISLYGLRFSQLSAAQFPVTELQDPAAQVFGCDPDYNAWTMRQNPRPRAGDAALRSCGGHIHVGYKFKTKAEAARLIKFMDLHHGVVSVLVDHGELRKQLYGSAGACRFKPYGVEYRTLSNFWTLRDDTVRWAWRATERAINDFENKTDAVITHGPQIVAAINNNDKIIAEQLVRRFNLLVP